MLRRFTIWLIFLTFGGVLSLQAQNDTLILFETETSTLQTGQYYTLSLSIRDVSEIWQANIEIAYDPQLIYIIGTKAGSPMKPDAFMPSEQSIVIRNSVTADQINYTQSLVAPAIPLSGGGAVATFQIYPLSAGTTQLTFRKANLAKVNYTENADGSRNVIGTELLPVLPVLLDLTITGDTVLPPSESTATPQPTPTVDPERIQAVLDETEEATLVNITLTPLPASTLGLIPDIEADTGASDSFLPIAIVLLVIGLLGIVGMLGVYFRRR